MALSGVSDPTRKKQEEYKNPSAAVVAAQSAARDYAENNDPADSKYGMVAEELLDEYLNREDFNYDVNGDALYAQYKDQYTKNANKAMKDTVAQSAAYTGGYANSWGQSAGQQVYQDYMTELDNKVPELRQQAYNEYLAEGEALLDKYGIAEGHYNDLLSRYYTERDYLDNKANEEYSRWLEERNYWDGVASGENADYWNGKNFDESVRQYDEQFAYQKQQDAYTNALNERSVVAQEAAADTTDAYTYYKAEELYRTGGEAALGEYLMQLDVSDSAKQQIAEMAMGSVVTVTDYKKNKNGTVTYTFNDGTEKTVKAGVNPYTDKKINVDANFLDEGESAYFDNGYQPRYLNGCELTDSGKRVTVAGKRQKVWTGYDENDNEVDYVWIGWQGKYVSLSEYNANKNYYNRVGGWDYGS